MVVVMKESNDDNIKMLSNAGDFDDHVDATVWCGVLRMLLQNACACGVCGCPLPFRLYSSSSKSKSKAIRRMERK